MKRILIASILGLTVLSCAEQKAEEQVKSLLIEQLENTHTNQEWFVPTKRAIAGLSPEQSKWKDSSENHSISELVSHLIFWNEMNLRAFKGEKVPEFNDENEQTFRNTYGQDWQKAIEKLDSVQTEWEKLTQAASDEKIKEWSTEIANMASHTAYHTGQIIYIRKRNGWWK